MRTYWCALIFTLTLGIGSTALRDGVWNNISLGKFYQFSSPPSTSYPDRWPVSVRVANSQRVLPHQAKLTDREADATALGGAVWNNISLGKFYQFSSPPSTSYSDRWPVSVRVANSRRVLSDGAKLTDGEVDANASGWPLDKWVAWYNTPFDVVIDLGKPYPVSHIHARAATRTEWAITFPASLTISVSSDGFAWRPYGRVLTFPPASGAGWAIAEVLGDGGWAYATRFVRYTFQPVAGQYIFLDELWVEGSIVHTAKWANFDGVYHGAFPATKEGYLRLADFEKLTGRRANMVLWYAGWDASFTNVVGQIIDVVPPATESLVADRRVEIGFLPVSPDNPPGCRATDLASCKSCNDNDTCITSEKIAAGSHDQFLADWFVDAANRNRPLWIRPMNEMNGSWTWAPDNVPSGTDSRNLRYGGDPLTYRWAWRRMYNIAEQVGATGLNQIFVWAPDVHNSEYDPITNPDERGDLQFYYPGPQYVDWIGFSLYKAAPEETYQTLLKSAYDRNYSNAPLWRHAIAAKPFMIVEGGAAEFTLRSNCKVPDDQDPCGRNSCVEASLDKPQFIKDWFYQLPLLGIPVKAAVWFDSLAACYKVNTSAKALQAYQPYFLDR